ncbi:MAG: nicotinamide riboside transporter PnuC [Flavobacteriaceae bacterium]
MFTNSWNLLGWHRCFWQGTIISQLFIWHSIHILIGIWVLYQTKLYADMVLHLYYLLMSIYGWLFWKYGRQKKETPISYSDRSEQIVAIAIVITCFALMVYWLRYYTNSDVPIWDAAVSAFAWAGMWLMAKRKMENWIYLNISNLISIPLLLYKELYIYAGLTVFLFAVGTSGYLNWRKLILEDNNGQPAQA